MISLAGHYISPLVSKVADFIGQYLSPRDVLQFDPTAWNHNLYHLAPSGSIQPPPISIGTLSWPTGASRFVTCYLLASDNDMEVLRPLLFTEDGPQPVTLIMNDATTTRSSTETVGTPDPTDNQITTTVYALPARPLQRITGENGLWLLTLVDIRYFWWFRGADIVVDVGVDTYNTLISQIALALGVTITADTVNSNYGTPSNRFTNRRCPLPLLLDAVCFYSGLRISRGLDGTIYANTYNSDLSRSQSNTDSIGFESGDWKPLAGGEFDDGDITQSVPDTVQVISGRTDDGVYSQAPYVTDTTLVSIGLAAYSGVTGFDGKKVLTGDLVATYVSASLTNALAIDDYVEQLSKDWYLWQLGAQDRSFSKIVPWDPTALDGTVVWEHLSSDSKTRVMRDTFNQMDWGRFRRSSLEGERSWIYDTAESGTTGVTVVTKICTVTGVLSQDEGGIVSLDGTPIGVSGVSVIVSTVEQQNTLTFPVPAIVGETFCNDTSSNECCPDPITTACCTVPVPASLYFTIINTGNCECLDGLTVPIVYRADPLPSIESSWWAGYPGESAFEGCDGRKYQALFKCVLPEGSPFYLWFGRLVLVDDDLTTPIAFADVNVPYFQAVCDPFYLEMVGANTGPAYDFCGEGFPISLNFTITE